MAAPPAPGRVELVAGDGLNEPFGVEFDGAGRTLHRRDGRPSRHRARRPTAAGRVLADDFKGPHHLLMGPDGALYVTDTWNYRVRRFDLPHAAVATVVAGTGEKGFSGDGGRPRPRSSAASSPSPSTSGALYICDLDNRRIRAVDLRDGRGARPWPATARRACRATAKTRARSRCSIPRAIAFDAKGNLYICERGGHALRVVDAAGKIRTVAGTGVAGVGGDGGPALAAQLNGPKHIFVEQSGDVLITDTENHVIRRYSPRDGTDPPRGRHGRGGHRRPRRSGPECPLEPPARRVIHPKTGALYISDSENHRVIRVGR